MNTRLLSLLLIFLSLSAPAQTTSPSITADDLKTHVRFLASDALGGRASGTDGNVKAAAYIAEHFRRLGLKPLGTNGGYLQPFEFVSAVRAGSSNALTFVVTGTGAGTLTALPDVDFRPLGFSADGSVTGPVVFAGYGITAPDKNYDDYAGIDVSGAVVIVLRHTPDGSDPHSDFSRHSSLRNKTRAAREKGAAGILVVTGPADDPEDVLIKLTYDQSFASSGLPAVTMNRAQCERLLAGSGWSLKALQDSLNASKKPHSFLLRGVTASLTTEVVKVTATTANVIGILEGSDPERAREAVVIGAHLDHLGHGGEGSGSLTPDSPDIHNGADDNASGSAALLELAEAFATRTERLPRSLVFVSFSGEELGTLGSGYYVNNPPFPLTSTVAMLNMDMVGRLKDNTLTVHGTGTSSGWESMVNRLNETEPVSERLSLKLVKDGVGPSDHSQFYGKDIPVLFFFTGAHEDYHKPSDDWEKINYPGEQKVTTYVERIAADVAGTPERPDFKKTESSSPMAGGGRGFTVTLGVIPDYAWSGEGMRIDGVRSNGPAEKAGMKGGDVITSLAGKKVMNIYDYMGILGELKIGDEVEVVVRRGEQVSTLKAVMTRK